MPSAQRKVSRPDSLEMPAPVRMTIRSEGDSFMKWGPKPKGEVRMGASVEGPEGDANAGVWPVTDLRAFLTGAWRIARTLHDARGGQDGSLEGTAEFSPLSTSPSSGGDLHYVETGILRLGDHVGPAEQTYRYAFPAPNRAEVFRRDGSPFHTLDLRTGRAEATHQCGADLYRGGFRVTGPDSWTAEWSVTGPRKD